MIVKAASLSKNFDENKNFYLLYGANNGLIEETIENILKPKLPKNIFNYDESEIISNIDEFEENILNKSFFDNEKLIIISRGSDKILKIIDNLLEKKISETVIIIKASILEKKSKLRSFFEKDINTICVPFYEDNYQSLTLIAKNFFLKNKINISTQNMNYIVEKSRKNRSNLNNELEKIKNFCHKKTTIDFNEILKLTNSAENYNISELVDHCLVKNKKKVINILNENISTIEDNILITRTFLNKLKRLKKLKFEIENKENLEQVISSFRPPIFWKDQDMIKQQLKNLTLDKIKTIIKKINKLELLVKKNSNFSNKITNNFVLEMLDLPNNSL
tara:strand:+ start:105 stop:1106 length:1002 start_codon:yes stop_codon:yes gene_type:complete